MTSIAQLHAIEIGLLLLLVLMVVALFVFSVLIYRRCCKRKETIARLREEEKESARMVHDMSAVKAVVGGRRFGK